MFHSGPFKICRRLAQGAQTILAETVTQQKHLYTRFTLYTNNVRSDLIEAVYRRAADMLLLVSTLHNVPMYNCPYIVAIN